MNFARRLLPALLAALMGVVAGCSSPQRAESPTNTPPATAPAASSASQASPEPGPAITAFLKVHNDARKAVHVPPLQWSAELAAYAQAWADQLAAQGGNMIHRTGSPYGENLASGRGGTAHPTKAAEYWLSERAVYRDGPFGNQDDDVGHYTAMVWRTTTHVGYGMATNLDGTWVVVANYSPKGNIVGQHPYR